MAAAGGAAALADFLCAPLRAEPPGGDREAVEAAGRALDAMSGSSGARAAAAACSSAAAAGCQQQLLLQSAAQVCWQYKRFVPQ